MKKYLNILLIVFLSMALFDFWGCASSKPETEPQQTADKEQDDMDEIERLLGLTPEEKQKAKAKSEKSDDDLLTLLKADEDKGTASAPTQSTAGDKRIESLQNLVEDMEDQLQEKNRVIADLKAQLMMKDEELRTLRINPPSSTPTTTQTTYIPSSPPTQTYSSSKSPFEQAYDEALATFRNGQYKDAINLFESLLAENRDHDLSDNAQYWIGECHYALGNYRAAVLAFEKVFSFPQSNKNDYAQFKIGLTYYKMGEIDRAWDEFQNLIDNYSNMELIDKAERYLAEMQ
jgi:TolA-binding protein